MKPYPSPPCPTNCSCTECEAAHEVAFHMSRPYFETFELVEIDSDSGHLIKVYVRRDNDDPCARMWQKANAALANSPKHSYVRRIIKPHEHYTTTPLPSYELDWKAYYKRRDALTTEINPFD